MPSPDTAATPANSLSRRSMLRSTAGAGAAGLALTGLASAPALAAGRTAARPEHDHTAEHLPADLADADDVVVHVRNVRTGELDVYRGTSHVRVTNRQLAAQLARASQ
jgi:nitrous oxide reductase